jgi:hypothetical protein
MTKPVTAICMMMLVDEGKVALDGRANASKFWLKLNHILLIFQMLCDSWLICHEITD